MSKLPWSSGIAATYDSAQCCSLNSLFVYMQADTEGC